jgi:hypothetical protein
MISEEDKGIAEWISPFPPEMRRISNVKGIVRFARFMILHLDDTAS